MKGMGFEWGYEEENLSRTHGGWGEGRPEALGRRLGSGGKGMCMNVGHRRMRSEREEKAEKEADLGLYGACKTNVGLEFLLFAAESCRDLVAGEVVPCLYLDVMGHPAREESGDWRRVKLEAARPSGMLVWLILPLLCV